MTTIKMKHKIILLIMFAIILTSCSAKNKVMDKSRTDVLTPLQKAQNAEGINEWKLTCPTEMLENNNTKEHLKLVSTALVYYHQDNGYVYPQTLDMIVPKFISELPRDNTGKNIFNYTVSEDRKQATLTYKILEVKENGDYVYVEHKTSPDKPDTEIKTCTKEPDEIMLVFKGYAEAINKKDIEDALNFTTPGQESKFKNIVEKIISGNTDSYINSLRERRVIHIGSRYAEYKCPIRFGEQTIMGTMTLNKTKEGWHFDSL